MFKLSLMNSKLRKMSILLELSSIQDTSRTKLDIHKRSANDHRKPKPIVYRRDYNPHRTLDRCVR